MTVTTLLFSQQVIYGFHVPKYLFFQLMVFLLLAVTLFRKEFIIRLNLLDVLMIFRPIYLMLLYFISARYSTVFENIDILGYLTLFYLLIRISREQDNRCKFDRKNAILIVGIVIVAILESIYGVLQYFGIDPFISGGYQSYESNAVGTFGSENALGGFLAACVPLTLFLIKRTGKKETKGPMFLGIGLILITLGLTISRGAWIALAVGLAFLFWSNIIQFGRKISSHKYLKIILIGLVIVLAVLLSIGIININPESSFGRLYIWRVSLGMVRDYPLLGVGYGNYGYQYLNYQAKFFSNPENLIYQDKAVGLKEAHSEIFHVLAETGVIGLLLFVSIIIVCFRYALKVFQRNQHEKDRLLFLRYIIASFIIICVHALVDNVLHVLPVALLFYFIIAIISHSSSRGKLLIDRTFKGYIVLPIMGILLLVLNGYFIMNKLNGYILWKKGQDAVHLGRCDNGIEDYKRALEYLPNNGELQFHLGAAYSYTGEAEQAIGLLTKSLKSFNDKNIYLTLGHAYRISGEYQKAEENFKKVTRMYPQMLLPHLWLAQMYHEMGKRDKSIQELQLIIDSKPKIVSDDVIAIKHDAERFLRIILKAD
ncbi:MAG: O-antigen ligase family protein [Fidelibacterota bacterium]